VIGQFPRSSQAKSKSLGTAPAMPPTLCAGSIALFNFLAFQERLFGCHRRVANSRETNERAWLFHSRLKLTSDPVTKAADKSGTFALFENYSAKRSSPIRKKDGQMVSKDFIRQLAGYGLTTAEILYRLPDHPNLLQSYIWQDYDVAPRFPVLRNFLAFWTENLDGPVDSVRVAHSRLIKSCELRLVDRAYSIN
jgi:uncharacterized protein Usg